MPSAALSYRRSSRKSPGVKRPGVQALATRSTHQATACSDCGCHCHGSFQDVSSHQEQANRTGQSKNTCHLCKKSIRYFAETLSCGHSFHADCYLFWLRVRTNVPEEKSLCPRCGFLEPAKPAQSKPGRRKRRDSSSSDSSLTSSTSSNCSSSSSDSGHSDLFFL